MTRRTEACSRDEHNAMCEVETKDLMCVTWHFKCVSRGVSSVCHVVTPV